MYGRAHLDNTNGTGLYLLQTYVNNIRVFIRHQRSENSPATTQNLLAKFCLFLERGLSFHNNPPVTLQYSPATPILNENPVIYSSIY